MGMCLSTCTSPTTSTGTGTGGRDKSAPRNPKFGKVKGGGNARGTRTGGSGKSAPIVPKFVKIEEGGNARGQPDAIKFRLVSYNILAKAYATSNHFPHSSPTCFGPCCFRWEARSQQILTLLKNLEADFYSLQELDEYDSFYKKSMEGLGYSSVYIQRSGGKSDGCGIFYKKNRFPFISILFLVTLHQNHRRGFRFPFPCAAFTLRLDEKNRLRCADPTLKEQ